MKSMDIYFSDLNEEAQESLLQLVCANDPKDMNWDLDVLPLFTYEVEDEEEIEEEVP